MHSRPMVIVQNGHTKYDIAVYAPNAVTLVGMRLSQMRHQMSHCRKQLRAIRTIDSVRAFVANMRLDSSVGH